MMKKTAADTAFSDFIRARDGYTCQKCFVFLGPKAFNLHCSHLWKRGNSTYCVRFDEANAMAACKTCHDDLEHHPEAHRSFFLKRLGQERYDALYQRAHAIVKRSSFDLKAIASTFRAKSAALGFYRGRGPALSTFVPSFSEQENA